LTGLHTAKTGTRYFDFWLSSLDPINPWPAR